MIAFIDAYRGQFGVELICCTLWAAVAGFSPHVAIGPPKPGRPRTGRSATRCSSPICARCTSRTSPATGSRSCHAAAGLADRPRTDRAVDAGLPRGPNAASRCSPPSPTRPRRTPADLVDRRFTEPVVGGGHHLMGPAPGLATPRLSPTRPPKRPSAGRVAVTMRTEDLPLQAFNHAVWQADSDLSESAHHSGRGSPHCRRHPAATPALSFPSRCRCSRRATGGRPGDGIAGRPAQSDSLRRTPPQLLTVGVLRRPMNEMN